MNLPQKFSKQQCVKIQNVSFFRKKEYFEAVISFNTTGLFKVEITGLIM